MNGRQAKLIIERKAAFTLIGIGRNFLKENCYSEIPKFWDEYLTSKERPFQGEFGVCIDKDDAIHYLIADVYSPSTAVLPGWETVTFEEGEWAMFMVNGPLPGSLQTVNTYVWGKWVPENRKYRLRTNYSIEYYPHTVRDTAYTHSEIWLPVSQKGAIWNPAS